MPSSGNLGIFEAHPRTSWARSAMIAYCFRQERLFTAIILYIVYVGLILFVDKQKRRL